MPDLVQLALLLVVGGLAGVLVALPFVQRRRPASEDDEHETLALRHRLAIEALRDVEADRRAGSLDDAGYARQRSEAEGRAAETLAALESHTAHAKAASPRVGWRPAALAGLIVSAILVVGFFVPAPIGLANQVVDTRQQAIERALDALEENPRDTQAFSDLADAYLAGGTYQDMQRGATALLALISLEPDNTSAYQRLISAYVRTGSWDDAAGATDSLAKLTPKSPDVPFFRGLIARGQGDEAEAKRQFREFLRLAPNDPRATMVHSLLDEND